MTNERQKRSIVVDYSHNINRYTLLVIYALPRMDETVPKILRHTDLDPLDWWSTTIKQVHLYTASKSRGRLYQFCRIPFEWQMASFALSMLSIKSFATETKRTCSPTSITSPYVEGTRATKTKIWPVSLARRRNTSLHWTRRDETPGLWNHSGIDEAWLQEIKTIPRNFTT